MIRFSEKALETIYCCVQKSNQKFEVGGILLGDRGDRTFQIEAATVPKTFQNCRRGSFQLDGAETSQQCREIIRKNPGLCVVGLWHSHLYGISEFSTQDQLLHRWLREEYGKTVSVLVFQREKNLVLEAYELRENDITVKRRCLKMEENIMDDKMLRYMAYEGECCKDCRFFVDGYCQCKDEPKRAYSSACADFEEM